MKIIVNNNPTLERRSRRQQAADKIRMAEQMVGVEQCLNALTAILARQNQPTSIRSIIEKNLRYISTFDGKPGTLHGFITSIERVLAEYAENQQQLVFTIIYQEKILGAAKNYLETSPPANWAECRASLKLHFTPSKNQGQIMYEINTLRVSTILELTNKVRNIVNDISECAIFSDFQNHIVNQLGSVLVLKIKELTAGSLAAELHNKFTVGEVRESLNTYVNQDQFNLKYQKSYNSSYRSNTSNVQNQIQQRQNFYNNNGLNSNNNTGQYRNQFNRNNSNNYNNANSAQYRRNFNRNDRSGQFRNTNTSSNNNNRIQPMDVDTINTNPEINKNKSETFFIN